MGSRPRRSVLYMPGSNYRVLEKARKLPADSLILDLEDAVAPDAKALGREQIRNAVAEGGYGSRELVVRVNALDTEWCEDDVNAIAQCSIDAVLFPKIETRAQLEQAVALLDKAGAPASLPVWIMAETPLGVLNITDIAQAHPRLEVIVMGTSDLAKDLRARHTADRIGFQTSLGLCVLAARANGLDIIDGVHLDLSDEIGFQAVCEQGRDMGLDGKSLIHPKQIAGANEAFGPSTEDITEAQDIIVAWEEASQQGKGVVLLNGKLVENLHVEEAQRTLALAKAIEALQ